MKKALLFAVLLVMPIPGMATAITGNLALAGLDTFSPTGITFTGSSTVLIATGSLSLMAGSTATTFTNVSNFGAEPGHNLFTWNGSGVTVTMMITSLNVLADNNNFLNVMGIAILTETGFDPTRYAFDFTSTRPDGTTSYTMDIAPAPVPELASLFLVGTGLLFMWLVSRRHKSRRNVRITKQSGTRRTNLGVDFA